MCVCVEIFLCAEIFLLPDCINFFGISFLTVILTFGCGGF